MTALDAAIVVFVFVAIIGVYALVISNNSKQNEKIAKMGVLISEHISSTSKQLTEHLNTTAAQLSDVYRTVNAHIQQAGIHANEQVFVRSSVCDEVRRQYDKTASKIDTKQDEQMKVLGEIRDRLTAIETRNENN